MSMMSNGLHSSACEVDVPGVVGMHALQVIPLTPDTLEMEIHFVDLSNATSPTLTVPGDLATQHGGVDYVLIKPAVASAGGPVPVALTALKLG